MPFNVQDIVAPFALENLGCSGNESRLVDCPVVESDDVDPEGGRGFVAGTDNPAVCDPYIGTFTTIICGTKEAAGARHRHRRSVCPAPLTRPSTFTCPPHSHLHDMATGFRIDSTESPV